MRNEIERYRLIASIVVLCVLFVVGVVIWNVIQERARAARIEKEIVKELSEDDLKEVLKSEATADLPSVREITGSPEKRKTFIKGLEQHLSLAAQARRDGLADSDDFQVNLKYKQDILLADLYLAKVSADQKKLYVVPKKDLEKVWKDPANEAEFKETMEVLFRLRKKSSEAKNSAIPVRRLKGESFRKARDNFARTKVLSAMARADKEFMKQPAIPLRKKILEAGLLANDYLIAKYPSFAPTDEEIAKYLADHPEYDPKRKVELAKSVLAKVKAGEDFENLAERYSEDSRSSFRGGLYEDISIGALWPEIERRAMKMKPGEIAPELVETDMGYHIVKLVRKGTDKNGGVALTIRHIVIHRNFEEPGEPLFGMRRPFMTPVEIAKQQVEQQKREEFIAQILAKNPISLPLDFALDLEKSQKEENSKND